MRFHGMMLLRDERDVIEENLNHLLTWIDALYVMDLGSVDGTWEIVQDFARRDPRVVPFLHEQLVYGDSYRSLVFDKYREKMDPGDWVLRLDADEFYHVPPPRFVAERMRPFETAAHLQWYFFRLTRQEADAYESGAVDLAEDRRRSILDRRRHYKISTYAEPRMFRYRRSMRWPSFTNAPFNAGVVARERMPILHYPHRDNLQMRRRYQLRAAMMKLKAKAGGHWKLEDWRAELVDEQGASDAAAGAQKQGIAGEKNIDTGPLLHWAPGTPLPEARLYNHIPPAHVRLAQRTIHSMMLPLFDRRRTPFDKTFEPTRIPPEVVPTLYSDDTGAGD